jgi:mannose-6-phosphate isomerase-like protein (cupin superfamily)
MSLTRRGFAALFPAMVAAQQHQAPHVLPSKAYPFEQLTGRQTNTNKAYQILTGDTHSGYRLDLHESELPVGVSPHPPHRHAHEELLFIREGEVEVTVNGQTTRLDPGSCAFMASNGLHGYRNSGNIAAKYFVLALGQD